MRAKFSNNKTTFIYLVSGVREVCQDLIELPRADETGFFEREVERDGEKVREVYGTSQALARVLKISAPTILNRVHNNVTSILGKNGSGRVCDLYPIKDVRTACHNLLKRRQKLQSAK